MKRPPLSYALTLILGLAVGLLIGSCCRGAALHLGDSSPPAESFRVAFAFTTEDMPRLYSVRDSAPSQWQDLDPVRVNGAWALPAVWVPISSPSFDFRPRFAFDWATVAVTEFLAAGDSSATMTLDARLGPGEPWNAVGWESPNLGHIERTYPITSSVPEPSTFWGWMIMLAAASLHMIPGRRNW